MRFSFKTNKLDIINYQNKWNINLLKLNTTPDPSAGRCKKTGISWALNACSSSSFSSIAWPLSHVANCRCSSPLSWPVACPVQCWSPACWNWWAGSQCLVRSCKTGWFRLSSSSWSFLSTGSALLSCWCLGLWLPYCKCCWRTDRQLIGV